jgi:hypothetical protein
LGDKGYREYLGQRAESDMRRAYQTGGGGHLTRAKVQRGLRIKGIYISEDLGDEIIVLRDIFFEL